jgi:hypothetical protein
MCPSIEDLCWTGHQIPIVSSCVHPQTSAEKLSKHISADADDIPFVSSV